MRQRETEREHDEERATTSDGQALNVPVLHTVSTLAHAVRAV